ncbi:MAG TPA: hypothetical protein VI485_04935 [Vicinamibacterales bacterium]|nr:hypothetical protein [Vicinamibacterales bacterium]
MEQRIEVGKSQMLRRACLVIAAFASLWAFAVAITGGFVIDAGPVRFSSRSPRRALLLMILASVAVWALYRKGDWRERWTADVKWLSALAVRAIPGVIRGHATPRVLAGVVAAMTVLVGIVSGAHVVGGSDSYGYVSQAHLFATGLLKVPQPLLDDLPADVPQEALVPLGYRLSPDRSGLVPTYASGLPMVMAVFERVGGRNAVFLVMPILAGLAVWATYAIGRLLVGELGGSLAAIFLATSPAFVLQLMYAPMSDIAAAAWWTTALSLVWQPGRLAAFAAGLATAAAILTRPNLVPLATVPGGIFLIGLWSRNERSLAAQRLLWFAAPPVVACSVVAYLNAYWYGSPFASGYGPLAGELFRWEYFWPNLANYTRWTLDSQGPLSLLSLVGLLALWRVARFRSERTILTVCICFAVGLYVCYAFYLPLGDWWSLRLLLPAFPIFFILIVAGGLAVADRLPHGWRSVGVAVLVAAMTVHVTAFGRSRGVFNSEGELRYEIVGRYINDHMPSRAVFFTMLHSGSVRHYSGRLTIRWDWIPAERFEATVTHLRQRGYVPFLLIDDAEEADFRHRFSAIPLVKASGTPQARFPNVSLYRLPDNHTTMAPSEASNPERRSR